MKNNIKFLKYISSMGKTSCNIALLREFGRYPLSIKVLVNTCKYLQQLLTTEFELLLRTYKNVLILLVMGK